jgi:excinuclease UvrABC ATPase subunit
MSMATRTDTLSPALHVADSHDLIRVHGARENNLKDVCVELPKRRLTVFTGVSGSGKSSLVHGSIPAGAGVVSIDHGAIRGSRRSNPATYTGLLDPFRRRSRRPMA